MTVDWVEVDRYLLRKRERGGGVRETVKEGGRGERKGRQGIWRGVKRDKERQG